MVSVTSRVDAVPPRSGVSTPEAVVAAVVGQPEAAADMARVFPARVGQ